MEKGKTPLDLYKQEVETPKKPQTDEEVLKRYEYLSNVKDDHFLRGEVYSNDSVETNQEGQSENNK